MSDDKSQEGQPLDIDLAEEEGKDITGNGNDFVPVSSVAVFARFITEWHSRAMAAAEHMGQIPDGQLMEFQNAETGENKSLVLTGEKHIAFIAGLNTAAQLFAQLPIVMQTLPADEVAEPAADAAPADAKIH